MPRLGLAPALLALIAGCAAPVPPKVAGLRSDGAPIYSLATLEPGRLEGDWYQVATFAPEGRLTCQPGGGLRMVGGQAQWALCLADGPVQGVGPIVHDGPGRMLLPGMAEWWVLWIDADNRTALIGTPDGSFGFVLNRDGAIAADRLKAAQDIAIFNGYRASDLVVF